MAESWYTKEDILRGLQEVSPGRRVADMDDNGPVHADRQPPRPLAYEDEQAELELLYGHTARDMYGQGDAQQGAAEPDLMGITQMLRMVQKYEDSSDDDFTISSGKRIVISKPNSNCVTIVNNKLDPSKPKDLTTSNSEEKYIQSKLNPNVKEFVPKFLQSIPSTDKDVNTSQSTSSSTTLVSTDNKSVDIRRTPNLELHDNSTSGTKTRDGETSSNASYPPHLIESIKEAKEKEKILRDEKREAARLLKSQISSKNDTLEQQQKTNSAIVKLLQLYSDPRPRNTVKLLTPEFFEKSIETNSKNVVKPNILLNDDKKYDNVAADVERMASLHNVAEDNYENFASKNNKNAFSCIALIPPETFNHKPNHCDENEDEVTGSTNLTPNLADCDINATPVTESQQEPNDIDPYIKDSIEKVNNWFDDKPVVPVNEENNWPSDKSQTASTGKSKAFSPVLITSAPAYKRKDTSSCKSPCEVTKKVPRGGVPEYKPTSYARELHKKYSQRSNASTPAPLNIWDKLEADLKKKDEEILARKKKASDM